MEKKRLKRKKMCKVRILLDGMPRRCSLLFLDSGAHSIYSEKVINIRHKNGYNWYKSKECKDYVDSYGRFLQQHKDSIDFYANFDVIFQPEMSWSILKYLENEYGLNPIPVIHYGTDLKWVEKHLNAGYTYLGIGGLGQEVTRQVYLSWADALYNLLCNNSKRLPCAKTHGFAMTSYRLMIRYPWYSVDSVSWAKAAGFGTVYVPHKRNGKFTFDVPPYNISFSYRSENAKKKGLHYYTVTPGERKIIDEWLERIQMKLGTLRPDGEPDEYGVMSQYHARAVANLRFYEEMVKWLPEWPWPFHKQTRRGFFNDSLL